MMNNKVILLLVLAIVAYLVYKYWKKTKEQRATNQFNQGNNTGAILSNVVGSTSGSINVNNVDVPPVILPGQYIIGSKVYAGPTGVNTYKSPTASVSFIDKYWRRDELIGTFLAKEKGYIKILTQRSVGQIEELFGYQQNVIVWALEKQVYTK